MAEQGAGQNAVSVFCFWFVCPIPSHQICAHSWVLTSFRFWIDRDFPQQNAATNLVGKLWTLCNKASERSGGAVDLCDKDAVAYAKWVMHGWILPLNRLHRRRLIIGCLLSKRAYKESMDIQKHGGRINLPQRLHENLPESLRYLLASEYESSRT